MYAMTHALWRIRGHTFEAPTTKAFVVEAPQVELALMDVARRLKSVKKRNKKEKTRPRDVGYEAALFSIEVVLRAAIENAEPVVIRKWSRGPTLPLLAQH